MKLALSTSCCHEWSFHDICSTAKKEGYCGVEIRKLGESVYAPSMVPFRENTIKATISKLAEIGIEIPILASSAVVGKIGLVDEAIAEVKAYSTLAEKLNTPYIRVLAGSRPDDFDCDLELIIDTLIEMCEIAKSHNTAIVVETNSIFSDVTLLKEVLELVKRENLGVVWDINYPYRFFDEPPEETVSVLGNSIKFVHVKDSIAIGERIEYRLMGRGDLPITDVLKALKTIDYTGYLSLEWIPKWSNELVEPSIVMAQYSSYMQRELRKS